VQLRHGATTSAGTAATAAALTATLGLAAASWVIAVREMNGMDMGVATRLGSFAFFAVLWVSMMAVMMLPGAAPAVVRRAHASGRVRAVPLFAGSYLAVWTVVGAAGSPRHPRPFRRPERPGTVHPLTQLPGDQQVNLTPGEHPGRHAQIVGTTCDSGEVVFRGGG
jgi:hypothetical protein